jgi:hypothetical protein
VVDCTDPAADDIFDIDSFVDFLRAKIKVQKKAGNLVCVCVREKECGLLCV